MTQISKLNCAIILTFLFSFMIAISPVQAASVSEVDMYELTFNPILYFNDQRLNPFGIPAVRNAINMLIDRQELIDLVNPMRFTTPLWTPLSKYGKEYPKLVSTFNQLEGDYAYRFTTAESIISDELISKKAYKYGGLWHYENGELIKLIIVIRIEDDRQIIGDYVADQLETLGFTIERLYKNGAEAHPIWLLSDPTAGDWHVYTGRWIFEFPHHEAENFQLFYTPHSSFASSPLWAAYEPDPDFQTLADNLALDAYPSEADRLADMQKALEWALKDSVRIWLMESPLYRHFFPLIYR
jgi:peptide/nickel transport system substrate-binding protein